MDKKRILDSLDEAGMTDEEKMEEDGWEIWDDEEGEDGELLPVDEYMSGLDDPKRYIEIMQKTYGEGKDEFLD